MNEIPTWYVILFWIVIAMGVVVGLKAPKKKKRR